jgi:hypothetical protein
LRLLLPSILVIGSCQLKYPLGVDLTAIVDEVRVAFDYLMVDYPFRIDYGDDGGRVNC